MSDVSLWGEGCMGREHEYKDPETKENLACLFKGWKERQLSVLIKNKELVESLL